MFKSSFIIVFILIVQVNIPFTAAKLKSAPSKMVYISGGFYSSTYSKTNNVDKEKVEPFFMDVYPVTNGEFLSFVKANPKWQRSNVKKIFADESYLKQWKGDTEPGKYISLKSPVTNVSWFAAKAYAEWCGKRLPTSAEWEYVASASITKPNAANDEKNINRILQWYSKKSSKYLPEIGSTEKNYWGVYDLFGLIWEWVYDFNTTLVSGDSRSDSGSENNTFCGGGSVGSANAKNYPAFMRFGFRSSLKANYTVNNLGFRCVKDVE